MLMSNNNNNRRQALQTTGLAHPRPDAVTAQLFHSGDPFFFAVDKVQVKYEMLRAHFGDGDTVTAAAATHGYSRAEFYLVAAAFEQAGMTGLLDERAAGRDRSSSPRTCTPSSTGWGPARRPRPLRRWPTSWGWFCIPERSSGPGGDEPVLAAGRPAPACL
jgi:hypothetical protein